MVVISNPLEETEEYQDMISCSQNGLGLKLRLQ